MTKPHSYLLRYRYELACTRTALLGAVACASLLAAAPPVAAYTPQVFDSTKDTGQDFTAVPANTAWNSSAGINQKVWNNIFSYGGSGNPGAQFYFAGSTGLWITSSQAKGWPSTGMMQQDNSCAAGFGYGDFHWRSAEGQINDGPGSNQIMWPADGDPGWPGIIKGSSDNHIGEVDVSEVNYGSNGTLYATLHYYNGSASGNNGQIMHSPITYPAGDMTSMHDYDVVWSAGSLVLKVDGVVQMSAPATQVRADYAHGGCNYTLGAQEAMQATGYDKVPDVWIMLANMWWSATDQSAGGGSTSSSGSSGSGSTSSGSSGSSSSGSGSTSTGSSGSSSSGSSSSGSSSSGSSSSGSSSTSTGSSGSSSSGSSSSGSSSSGSGSTSTGSTSTSSGGLAITSLVYGSGKLTATVSQTIAGGIKFRIDGVYAGTARDSSPVGTHHLIDVFSKIPSAGKHTATYYLTAEQSTSAVTGSFTVP